MHKFYLPPRITRPAVLVMAYKRHDVTAKTLAANLNTAGMDFGLFVGDHRGICRNSNIMLWRAMAAGYDAFCIMGNDITEPYGWLKARVDFANERSTTCGGVSVPIDWMTSTPKEDTVIGNILWPRDVVEKVGAWDERLDPHGPVDLDYCNRANKAGYKNWYLPNMMANHHWGHDGNLYGYDKQAVIKEKWDLYCHTVGDPNFYIPFEDMTKYYEQ